MRLDEVRDARRESSTDRGRSVWEAIYAFLRGERVVTRKRVLERFYRDDEAVVRGVLHDLTESGLVFVTGSGQNTTYRLATEEELAAMQSDRDADELVWVIVYRYGPVRRAGIEEHLSIPAASFDTALDRLVATGRVQKNGDESDPTYSARELVVPLDATAGWEQRRLGRAPRRGTYRRSILCMHTMALKRCRTFGAPGGARRAAVRERRHAPR